MLGWFFSVDIQRELYSVASFKIEAFVAWMPFNKFDNKLLTLEVWRLVAIATLSPSPYYRCFIPANLLGELSSVATLVVPIGIGAVFISTAVTEVLRQASATNGQEIDAGHMTQTELLLQNIQPTVAYA